MIRETNPNGIQNLISLKRENFRVMIRKTKQESFLNSKRFLDFYSENRKAETQNLDKNNEICELETDIFTPNEEQLFAKELINTLSSVDYSAPYTKIPTLKEFIKKTCFLIEKKNWFAEEIIRLLLKHCFRYQVNFEPGLIVEFCYLLEKLFICCSFFSENLISMRIIEILKCILQNNRKNSEIIESVFFCLSHISSDTKNFERLMRIDIILEIIITLSIEKCSMILTRIISWLIFNISTNIKDLKDYYRMTKFLFTICGQMLELNNKEIRICNLSSLSSLIEEEEEKLDDFCFNEAYLLNDKTHILDVVNKCFCLDDEEIRSNALKVFYKISLGNQKHSFCLIEKHIVETLIMQLDNNNNKDELKQQILLIICNILDESSKHVQYCIDKGLYQKILKMYIENSSFILKKECVFCLEHSTYSMNEEQLHFLLSEAKILEVLCKSVEIYSDLDVLKSVFSCLENILVFEEKEEKDRLLKFNFCKSILEEWHFERNIENFINYEDEEVSKKIVEVLNILNN